MKQKEVLLLVPLIFLFIVPTVASQVVIGQDRNYTGVVIERSGCEGDEVLLGNGSCQSSSVYTNGLNGTDTNETTRFTYLTDTDCPAGQLVIGVQVNGTVLCAADSGSGSGNPFDQWLNTTNNVTFYNLTITQDIIIGSTGVSQWLYNQTQSIYFYNQTFVGSFNYNQTDTAYFYNMTDTQYYYNMTVTSLPQNLTNVAFKNESNIFTERQNFTDGINIIKGSNFGAIYIDDAGNTIFT